MHSNNCVWNLSLIISSELLFIASVVIPNPMFCFRAPVFYISDSGQLSQLYNVCGKVGGVQLHQSALIVTAYMHTQFAVWDSTILLLPW